MIAGLGHMRGQLGGLLGRLPLLVGPSRKGFLGRLTGAPCLAPYTLSCPRRAAHPGGPSGSLIASGISVWWQSYLRHHHQVLLTGLQCQQRDQNRAAESCVFLAMCCKLGVQAH